MAKRSKIEIKRSRAAKRGWATRRKNQSHKYAKIESDILALIKKRKRDGKNQLAVVELLGKLPLGARSDFANRNPKVLPKISRDLAKASRATRKLVSESIAFHTRMNEMVHANEPEMLHRDGTIAIQPSSIRHLDTPINDWLRKRLSDAEESGNLDLEVNMIARELSISVQEVYTFWYSP